MASRQIYLLRTRTITSLLVLGFWLAALLSIPLHAGAAIQKQHGHEDCAAACCSHPGMVADVPSVPPAPPAFVPEPAIEIASALQCPVRQTGPAAPSPTIRGGPPDLQVFLT